jgi:hypothetical protein
MMYSSEWYAAAVAATAASLLCFYLLQILSRFFTSRLKGGLLRLVYYRHISTEWRGLDTTWLHAFLIAVLLLGNASYLITMVFKYHRDPSRQAALLSAINLIPLAFGGHMSSILDLCGLDLDGQHRLHRWLAWVAAIEGVGHGVAELAKAHSIKSLPQIAAVTVRSSLPA